MPNLIKPAACCCTPTAGVGDLFDATSWGDVFGNVLQTGLQTGAQVGIQYGLAELTGNNNRPGTPVGYAAPVQTAVAPVVTQTAPAAPAINSTTVMIGAGALLLAVLLTR